MAKAKRKAPDKETLRELFLKSGNVCAFPGCTHLMMNKDGEFIGQVCHIEAAEEGGERFNENMTDEERATFPNLMLMCYEHHVVTNDVDKYPVPRLQAMKAEHEAKFTDPTRAMEEGYAKQISGDVRARQHASHGGINVAGHGNTIIQGFLGAASDPFADLDNVMGPFLDALRAQMQTEPTWRDIVLIEGNAIPGMVSRAFVFRDEIFPDISSWVDVLEDRGLVRDATKGGFRRVRMGHEFVQFLGRSEQTPRRAKLSDHAARLLCHAAAGDGMVMIILHSGGLSVQAGTLRKVVPHDHARAQAMWRSGAQELLSLGLTEQHGTSGEMFDLTKEGWEAIEALPPETVQAIRAKTDE
ncbi:MAG TPA: hypothetical protein VGF55_15565 [Gemmataceae bacterium]